MQSSIRLSDLIESWAQTEIKPPCEWWPETERDFATVRIAANSVPDGQNLIVIRYKDVVLTHLDIDWPNRAKKPVILQASDPNLFAKMSDYLDLALWAF